MASERRTILALVAAGRITAGEAERLLRAWNEELEFVAVGALCLIVWLAQLHLRVSADGAIRLVHELVREWWNAWGAAASLLRKGMGGSI
ncbi:MAG TPA: hypothetical protein VGJ21_12090 [Terracidiphilus sp.]|jgi:hypothetical protein